MLAQEQVARLVVGAQQGQAAALTALVAEFLRPAYSVALSIVRRPADAEDVAQEALVAATEKIGSCREPARFAGWLLSIVRNRALNFLERRRLRDVAPTESSSRVDQVVESTPIELGGTRERLLAALDRLTEMQREVVLLHDLEEWTHAEIGEALGVSELMSRQHLFNARRLLRVVLAEDAPEEVLSGS